jgi:hypothetical protein
MGGKRRVQARERLKVLREDWGERKGRRENGKEKNGGGSC